MNHQDKKEDPSADMEELRRRLLSYAKRLISRWPVLWSKIDAEDLVQEVIMRELENPHAVGPRDRRTAYLKVCIQHLLFDLAKKNQPDSLTPDKEPVDPASTEIENVSEETLSKNLIEISRILSDIRWLPNGHNVIDYFALFLLFLRLALVNQIRKSMKKQEIEEVLGPYTMSKITEKLLPWRDTWKELPIKPGWVTLEDAWLALSSKIDKAPYRIAGKEICDRLMDIPSVEKAEVYITVNTLSQWLIRAKKRVRHEIGEQSWQKLFSNLFPDHQRQVLCTDVIERSDDS